MAGVAALVGCDSGAVRGAVTAPTIIAPETAPLAERVLSVLPGVTVSAPEMAWGQREGSDEWTAAALAALNDEGVTLLSTVPADVLQYCPGYATQSRDNRAAFWAGFLSKVAGQESGWNPLSHQGEALGLLGITKAAAQQYKCADGLLDVQANMTCAVRILSQSVVRDGAIMGDEKQGWRGMARDWLKLRSSGRRTDIANWTSRQSYCK